VIAGSFCSGDLQVAIRNLRVHDLAVQVTIIPGPLCPVVIPGAAAVIPNGA